MEELRAVRALDEDIVSCGLFFGYSGFYGLYILEFGIVAVDVLKLLTHKPDGFDIRGLQIVDDALMLLLRYLAELAHSPQNRHLIIGLHQFEILEGSHHR